MELTAWTPHGELSSSPPPRRNGAGHNTTTPPAPSPHIFPFPFIPLLSPSLPL